MVDGKKHLRVLKPLIDGWQMFLPVWQVESHLERWQMLIANCGWWNSQLCEMADVIATVADGIATQDGIF